MPQLEHALRNLTDRILAARADGSVLQIRGGGSKDFLGTSHGAVLDTRSLGGIISYEPTELVVTVASGTPLHELEALLAEKGQYLPFEPPHYRWSGDATATVGGMVASGLAGPARASAGGVRDYVLGLRLINGLGEHLTFGGQVMKNVAGYDVSRLMVGARGTLGLITEVSLKVLPKAPAETTLCFTVEQAEALEHLHRWGGEPLPLNASCWVLDPQPGSARPPEGAQSSLGRPDGRPDDSVPGAPPKPSLYVRLRGAVAAVEAACQRMLSEVPGERHNSAQTAADWALCRDQQLPFFATPPQPDAVLWRLSVPQTAPVLALPAQPMVEWHGGLRWVWAPLSAKAELQAAAQAVGGSAQVFVAPGSPLGAAALQPQGSALQAITQRLKASFDPQGIFNPGLTSDANQSRA